MSQWTSVKCSCRCSCVGGLGCASVTARDHAFFSRQCAPPVGKPLVIGVQTYPRRRLFLNKEFYRRPAAVDVVSVVGSRRRPQHPASQGRVVTYSPPTVADSLRGISSKLAANLVILPLPPSIRGDVFLQLTSTKRQCLTQSATSQLSEPDR